MLGFFIRSAIAAESLLGSGSSATVEQHPLASLLPLVALIIASYFFIVQPGKDRQKKVKKMVDGISIGDRVETTGGVLGTIVSINDEDDCFVLCVAAGVNITVKKRAIFDVLDEEGKGKRDVLVGNVKGNKGSKKDSKEKK